MSSGRSVSIILGSFPKDEATWMNLIAVYERYPDLGEVLVAVEGPSQEWAHMTTKGTISIHCHTFEEGSSVASRLNFLVSQSEGDICLIFDDTYVLSSAAFANAVQELEDDREVFIEFSRLKSFNDADFNDPEKLFFHSSELSRYERGGAIGVRRRGFLELRGFDERIDFEECLFLDILTRHLRRGGRISRGGGEIHSVFSLRSMGARFPVSPSREDVKRIINRLGSDPTIYRNLSIWSVPSLSRPPLVCVAIATHNRALLLAESIKSVLAQSFQDFEIVVVDDGSDDAQSVQDVVAGFGDPRIRLFRHELPKGVSAARNKAADETRSPLTAVHDDDDLMLPNRLLQGIEPLSGEIDATYGGWVNFHHDTGELRGFLTKMGFSTELIAFSGQGPGHSTWTIATKHIRAVRYDERLSASVDHNLASRLAWRGVKWAHIQKFMYLRRVHADQITALDGRGQKIGHLMTLLGNEFMASPDERIALVDAGKKLPYPQIAEFKDLANTVGPYLPDHLVTRDIEFQGNVTNSLFLAEAPERSTHILEDRNLITGRAVKETGLLENATLDDLVSLRRAGLQNWSFKNVKFHTSIIDHDRNITVDNDIIHKAEVEIQQKVTEALDERFQDVQIDFFRKYPDGYTVVQRDREGSLSDEIPIGLERAVTARRIVSAGEFGLISTIRIFGFKCLQDLLDAINNDVGVTFPTEVEIYPEVTRVNLGSSMSQLLSERLLESKILLDDSGLGGSAN